MELWSLFRKVRKIVFGGSLVPLNANMLTVMIGFVAVISLAWAVLLSIYLFKEWNDFTILQRTSLPLPFESEYRFDP